MSASVRRCRMDMSTEIVKPRSATSYQAMQQNGGKQTSNKCSGGSSKKVIKAAPFSALSRRDNVVVTPPPKAGAFQEKTSAPSDFSYFYERGDFPIMVEHETSHNKIAWKV